ncbi:MAG TPA: gamma-glutamyl-gamma-aminobutyrate hydrolase family protein [Thermoanaerobaculia bacterium]
MSRSRDLVLVATGTDEYAAPYVESLRAAGFAPEEVRTVTPDERNDLPELAARAAGLVLCGGVDVMPERYGEEVLPDGDVEVFPERDEMEWSLLDAAREARIPVWGICRGLQVLNVYLGGSLWQDLPSQCPSDVPHSILKPLDALAHPIEVIDPGTGLGQLLSRDTPRVNSRHHQAIKRLADGFVPVARSADGLLEAVELPREDWWVRAVQWHPENLIAMPRHRALWDDFARAVRKA